VPAKVAFRTPDRANVSRMYIMMGTFPTGSSNGEFEGVSFVSVEDGENAESTRMMADGAECAACAGRSECAGPSECADPLGALGAIAAANPGCAETILA